MGFVFGRAGFMGALLALAGVGLAWAQGVWSCSCGANPQGPPRNRELRPYADAPADLRPYANLPALYHEYYGSLVESNGAARDLPTLKASDVDEVRIGFLGPLENHPDGRLGRIDGRAPR